MRGLDSKHVSKTLHVLELLAPFRCSQGTMCGSFCSTTCSTRIHYAADDWQHMITLMFSHGVKSLYCCVPAGKISRLGGAVMLCCVVSRCCLRWRQLAYQCA
jgi:hypothetical protein